MPSPDDIVPILSVLLVFGIPIIAILTKHQQKMAQMFHESQQRQLVVNPETQMLREEIRELKTLVHQQSIAIDDMAARRIESNSVEQRQGS